VSDNFFFLQTSVACRQLKNFFILLACRRVSRRQTSVACRQFLIQTSVAVCWQFSLARVSPLKSVTADFTEIFLLAQNCNCFLVFLSFMPHYSRLSRTQNVFLLTRLVIFFCLFVCLFYIDSTKKTLVICVTEDVGAYVASTIGEVAGMPVAR